MTRSTRLLTRAVTVLAAGCLTAGLSACSVPTATTPGSGVVSSIASAVKGALPSAPTRVLGGPELPADLCVLNSPDQVLSTVGLSGPGFPIPLPATDGQDPTGQGRSIRMCQYSTGKRGGSVSIILVKPWSRADFDTSRDAAVSGTYIQGVVGDMPGLTDAAFSFTTRSHDLFSNQPIPGSHDVGVIALDGDVKIQVSGRNLTPDQLGALVTLIAGELH